MLEQRVQNPPLKPLQGVGVVAAGLAAAALGSAAFSRLAVRVGSVASIGFIVYGMAIAGFLIRRYVLAYRYQAGPDCLHIDRLYGRYARAMTDVWYGSVSAWGTPEDVRAKHPSAPVSRAVCARCGLAPFAMAHQSGGRTVITVIQPDDSVRQRLEKAFRGAKN